MRFLFLSLAFLACSGGGTGATDTGNGGPSCARTFTNPIGPGADPWVIKEGSTYYGVESRGGGIWVTRSDTLTKFRGNAVRVWSPRGQWASLTDLWAPELHKVGDRWYIYFAGGGPGPSGQDAEFTDMRAYVLESTGSNPQGSYTEKARLYTGPDVDADTGNVWAIDMTVQSIGGQLYAVWSGWEENAPTHRTPQHTYIARMANPWTISSNRVKLSSPTAPWEVGTELSLQEGQEFLVNGERTFIVYSTRESWLPAYKLGLLALAPGADPLDPASWTKSAGPVFVGNDNEGVHGVGHASFTTSPDGSERWIAYHSKSQSTPGWNDRVVRLQKFGWNADGTPNFGVAIPSSTALPVPAGQCQ